MSTTQIVARAPNYPLGISFLGRLWNETGLILYAYAFEQRTMVRNNVQPFAAPSIELDQIVGMKLTGMLGGNVRTPGRLRKRTVQFL